MGYQGIKFLTWSHGSTVMIVHLNIAEWLFGAQFTDIPIAFMDMISHDMCNILLQECFKFASFVDSAEASNLSMQLMKDCAMLPIIKEGFDSHNIYIYIYI